MPSLRDAVLVALMGYAGLRPSEAFALRWRSCSDRGILVEEAFVDGELKDPKVGRRRPVELVAPLADDLVFLRREDCEPAQLVAPNRYGQPLLGPNWQRRVFLPAVERAGLEGVTRMNTLRHSFASALIHEGRPVNYVQAQLGHSTPMLTLGTYSHLFDEAQLGRGVEMVAAISAARGPLPAHLLIGASVKAG